jgi:hypothetical protein
VLKHGSICTHAHIASADKEMNAPGPEERSRRGHVRSPEATQEIDASDVLEVSELGRPDPVSSPSIRPVGIDVELAELRKQLALSSRPPRIDQTGRGEETCEIRLVARRRELSRYVIGAVAVSCAILVASLVKHETAESHAPAHAVATSTPPPVAKPATRPSYASTDIPPPPAPIVVPAAVPAAAAAATVTAGATATAVSGSGTLRFTVPAKSSWIWVDGKRLTGTSAIVSCGTHQVKVGYYPKHSVVVPCDGEVVLSR